MDTNQIVLGIVLVGIIVIAGITVYNQFVPSQTITQIGESTTSINAEVAKLIASLSALTTTTGTMNTSLTKFIQDSQDYYSTNSKAIAAINDLINSLQSSVFSKDDLEKLLTAANNKLKSMKSGTFVDGSRGYFSLNDTAEQIAVAVDNIQNNLTIGTKKYLIQSTSLANYLKNQVESKPLISEMNTKIQTIQSDLDKTISNLSSYLDNIANVTASIPINVATYCYRYANEQSQTRTLFYRPTDGSCASKWGWGFNDPNVGAGGNLVGFTSQLPNTAKYCYRYADNPTRTLFYRPPDGSCSPKWGWGINDPNVGMGGELYLYPTQQPNTRKMCYRYAANPMRTLLYQPDATGNCAPQWGWGFNDPNVGAGGEVWVPIL